jgi:hypothetical protein
VHILVAVYWFFLKIQANEEEEENKSRKMNIYIFTAKK